MNKLLIGKNAIISKGRRPPTKGAIPPARATTNKLHAKSSSVKPVKHVKDESKTWKEKEEFRRHSMKWHDDPICLAFVFTVYYVILKKNFFFSDTKLQKSSSASSINSFKRRSDSSSYSEDSDNDDNEGSSTSTSLCDDLAFSASSVEASPIKKKHSTELPIDKVHRIKLKKSIEKNCAFEDVDEPPDITKSISDIDDNKESEAYSRNIFLNLPKNDNELASTILSISQLSPMPDISKYFESSSSISPLKTPSNFFEFSDFAIDYSNYDTELDEIRELKFEVDDEGVTNELFERINLERSDALFTKPDLNNPDNNAISVENLSPLDNSVSSASLTFENIDSQSIMPFITLQINSIENSQMDIESINKSLDENSFNNLGTITSHNTSEDSVARDNCNKMTKLIEENSKMLNELFKKSIVEIEDLHATIETIMEESEPTTPLQETVILSPNAINFLMKNKIESFEMMSRNSLTIICEEIPEETEDSEITPTNRYTENVEEVVKQTDVIPEILISLHDDSETESSFEIIENPSDFWDPIDTVIVESFSILEKKDTVNTPSFNSNTMSSNQEVKSTTEHMSCSEIVEIAGEPDENSTVSNVQKHKICTDLKIYDDETQLKNNINDLSIVNIIDGKKIPEEILKKNFKDISALTSSPIQTGEFSTSTIRENNNIICSKAENVINTIDKIETNTATNNNLMTKIKHLSFIEQRPEDIINELLASKDTKQVQTPNDECSVDVLKQNSNVHETVKITTQSQLILETEKSSALSNSDKILENLNMQLAKYSIDIRPVKDEKEFKLSNVPKEYVKEFYSIDASTLRKDVEKINSEFKNAQDIANICVPDKHETFKENSLNIHNESADTLANLKKPFIFSDVNHEFNQKEKEFLPVAVKIEYESLDDLKLYQIEKSASDKILEKLHLQLDKYEVTKKNSDELTFKSPQFDHFGKLQYNKSLANLEDLLNKNDGISNASSLQASYSSEKTPVDESTNSIRDDFDSGYQPLSDAKREYYLNSVYDLLNQEYKNDGSDKEFVCSKKPQKTNSNDSICSSTSTISDTLSSIKNSIKSIDSLCQKKSDYNNAKKRNKTLENIEKICENDKDWKNYQRSLSPVKSSNHDSYSEYHISRSKDCLDVSNTLKPGKVFRDRSRSRDRSPRGKRNDSVEDYYPKSFRDPSPQVAIKVEDVESNRKESSKFFGSYNHLLGYEPMTSNSKLFIYI